MTSTIAELLAWASAALHQSDLHQRDTARLDAELLLAHTLKKDRSYLFTWPERGLSPEQDTQFRMLLNRRVDGEPVAYLIGEQGFWTLNLKVTPATLIPRPETELLVESVLANAQATHAQVADLKLLDLGTGSGAIALALASEQPGWQVTAVDYSQEALVVAQDNGRNHKLSNVNFLRSDWFSALAVSQKFDVIVSNPPYIDERDPHLSQGDVRFEPSTALVAPNNGLADIETIARSAPEFLNANGWLLFEHGYDQGDAAVSLLQQLGFRNVRCVQDFGGRDRVTQGQWQ